MMRSLPAILLVVTWGLPLQSTEAPSKRPLDIQKSNPRVACTAGELQRLRQAYGSKGPERAVVTSVVESAERFLSSDLEFPPRGGQHNQWYQCDACQISLRTVDPTHHRCPKCGTVYSGEPYDDVIFSRVHSRNLRGAEQAAWAYAITGEARFAKRARQVLLGYAERYREYPYHSASRSLDGWGRRSGGHLYEQTLTEASALTRSVAPAYDLVRGCDVLSEDDRRRIDEGLLHPMLENIDRNKAGKSNWQSWHNAAFVWGGAVLGEEDWIRKALDDPENGFEYQMRVSVSEDGMWYENSWGYHLYTLSALVATAEGARRCGMDLWGSEPLRRMCLLPMEYAMPDGTLPRFGDDVRTTVGRAGRYLEYLHHSRPDPRIRPYLPEPPTWDSILLGREPTESADAPPLESRVFRSTGHAILRAPGETGLAAAMTFGPYGGFHGHFDKLSFVFFGHGRELGVDPGRARSQAYRLPIHRDWYKATLSHNTVLVDQRSQAPAEGRLELFVPGDNGTAVAASCEEAYPGVRQARLLALEPQYLLVVDELRSEDEHRYDWVYHQRARRVDCEVAAEAGDLGESCPGYQYVKDVRSGKTSESIQVTFEDEAIQTHLTVAAGGATGIVIGHGVGASVEDRVPMILLTRTAPTVRFAVVLEPVRRGDAPTVRGVTLEPAAGDLRIRVDTAAGTDELTWDGAGTLRFR